MGKIQYHIHHQDKHFYFEFIDLGPHIRRHELQITGRDFFSPFTGITAGACLFLLLIVSLCFFPPFSFPTPSSYPILPASPGYVLTT
jgi:hypothetical protein